MERLETTGRAARFPAGKVDCGAGQSSGAAAQMIDAKVKTAASAEEGRGSTPVIQARE